MDREFLDLYNRELSLLYEQAGDFAEQYPGIAERLGGLVREHGDPMIAGLLEGTAFLAARVQLKLQHEFPEFTANLLEQLVPNYLAPTPSAMLVKALPAYGDRGVARRKKDRERCLLRCDVPGARAECRLPFSTLQQHRSLAVRSCAATEYYLTAGPMQALGVPVERDALAGLRLSLTHRMAARVEDEIADEAARTRPEFWFAGCRMDELPIYLCGAEDDAIALYEQIIGNCIGVYIRYLDDYGDPVVTRLPPDAVQQVGFDEQDSLFPIDNRVFRGSELLREYFTFPRKFLGFKLTRLREIMPRLRSKSIDIVFAFDEQNSRLAAAVEPKTFSLHTAPAINLFEKSTDRIAIAPNAHEYHVVPDRSRYLDYEPHRVIEVFAHFSGAKDKVPVRPLYSASVDPTAGPVEPALLHGPPASQAANHRRESPRRDLRLCRDGYVHFPPRAGRAER